MDYVDQGQGQSNIQYQGIQARIREMTFGF
jgi:hypothetical protein